MYLCIEINLFYSFENEVVGINRNLISLPFAIMLTKSLKLVMELLT